MKILLLDSKKLNKCVTSLMNKLFFFFFFIASYVK